MQGKRLSRAKYQKEVVEMQHFLQELAEVQQKYQNRCSLMADTNYLILRRHMRDQSDAGYQRDTRGNMGIMGVGRGRVD